MQTRIILSALVARKSLAIASHTTMSPEQVQGIWVYTRC